MDFPRNSNFWLWIGQTQKNYPRQIISFVRWISYREEGAVHRSFPQTSAFPRAWPDQPHFHLLACLVQGWTHLTLTTPCIIFFFLPVVSFSLWRCSLWMFHTPCNHLGGFQDLSAPRVILETWLRNPGMHPSLAGSCCCCWLYTHAAERKSTLVLGSQSNLTLLVLEQSSGSGNWAYQCG